MHRNDLSTEINLKRKKFTLISHICVNLFVALLCLHVQNGCITVEVLPYLFTYKAWQI